MLDRLTTIAGSLKQEILVYRLLRKDIRVPVMSKVLLGLAVGYTLMPFDLIPDWIPLIGHLDDLIIVPMMVYIALKLVPIDIIEERRNSIHKEYRPG